MDEPARRIRNRQAESLSPGIPIIAVTANTMSGDRDKCIAAGMSDYLAKPIEARQLREILEKWLSRPNSALAAELPAKTESVYNENEFLARLMGDKEHRRLP
jgi:two-component system, sensor histidine kinase and response regulator